MLKVGDIVVVYNSHMLADNNPEPTAIPCVGVIKSLCDREESVVVEYTGNHPHRDHTNSWGWCFCFPPTLQTLANIINRSAKESAYAQNI